MGPSRPTAPLVAWIVFATLGAWACDSRTQSLADVAMPERAPRVAIEQVAGRLRAALEASGMTGSGALEYDVRESGPDLYIVRAVVPGSYPGTGVAATVVAGDGASYGIHGDRDLADLVRALGWLPAPPDPEALLRLVDAAYFEGMGSTTLTGSGASGGPDGASLTLSFDQFTPPGPSFPWQWVVPAAGPARLYTIDNVGEGSGGWLQVR